MQHDVCSKNRQDTEEKVRQGMLRLTGCSTVFHGRDTLDTKEKARQAATDVP